MLKITGFTCEFCGKIYLTSGGAKKHEKEAKCLFNPVNKACNSCIHYESGNDEYNGFVNGCHLDKAEHKAPGRIKFKKGCDFYVTGINEYNRMRMYAIHNNIMKNRKFKTKN